ACKGGRRFMLVTDAMPNVGTGMVSFDLQGRTIFVKDGRCVDEAGVLSGSALDMAGAVRNAISMLGVSLEKAVEMASAKPAQFIGLGAELGRIDAGLKASFVVLDESLGVRETWIEGERRQH
ncbi:MAG TPA: amidohydrolase family protein, partial [Usitatibacter sp.]|nr:amidohydrolase family protein [Usitatibacter sp.]